MALTGYMLLGFVVVLFILIVSVITANIGVECYNENKTFASNNSSNSAYFGYSIPAPVIIPIFGMISLAALVAGSSGWIIKQE